MTASGIRLVDVSEFALILYLADKIDISQASVIARISQRIEVECLGVIEVTPSYTSILVETHPTAATLNHLRQMVLEIARQEIEIAQQDLFTHGKLIELPVYYHHTVGPDLQAIATHANLSIEEVIAIHSGTDYTVCAIGFSPGFAFLAEVDKRIATPRHPRPRARVPAGSVGIADQQTAVYPNDSPGGWSLLGACPVSLYNPGHNPMCPFEIGDRVRFLPIDRATFIERGGCV